MTGLAPFAAVLVAYVCMHAVLALAARPLRHRLVIEATDLLDEPHRSPVEREMLNRLIETCTSSKVGVYAFIAAGGVVSDVLINRKLAIGPTVRKFVTDPRLSAVVDKYVLSVMLANPLAAVASFPPILLAVIIVGIRGGTDVRQVAEEPVMRASATLQAC